MCRIHRDCSHSSLLARRELDATRFALAAVAAAVADVAEDGVMPSDAAGFACGADSVKDDICIRNDVIFLAAVTVRL